MGYGLIEVIGKKCRFIGMGTIHLSKFSDHQERLKRIDERMEYLIKEYTPNVCAIESPFYGKNVQSMLKLGRAQGVAMAAALRADVPVFEYAPKKIKQSITGNGNASKEQVAAMILRILDIKTKPKFLDATDGIAAALCYFFQNSNAIDFQGSKEASNWEQFVKQNPEKIR